MPRPASNAARAALDGARARATELLALEHRRTMISERLAVVDARLAARDRDEQEQAERQRASLVARGTAYGELGVQLDAFSTRAGELHGRLREQRRRQSEAARASAEQLDSLRTERSELERELTEVRERAQRAEIDDAETRLRLETAVERLRTDYDVEPESRSTRRRPGARRHHARRPRPRPRPRAAAHGPDQPARARRARRAAGAPPASSRSSSKT